MHHSLEMKLFPKDFAILATETSASEVADAIRRNTEALQPWFSESNKMFFGQIESNHFIINRNLKGFKNLFAPRMTGVIIPGNSGTRINVQLMPLPLVKALMILWFGCLFILGSVSVILGILGLFLDGIGGALMIAGPFIILAFGLLLTHGALRFYVPYSKQCLIELLNATEVSSEPD